MEKARGKEKVDQKMNQIVSVPLRTMVEVWLGHDTILAATRAERLRIEGTRKGSASRTRSP